MTDPDDDKATAAIEPPTVEAPAVEAPTLEAAIEPTTIEAEAKEIDESDAEAEADKPDEASGKRKTDRSRILAYVVLPVLVLAIALAAAFFKYVDSSARDAAGEQAMQAAKDTTIAILSYKPETVEQQLTDARGRLTGQFRDAYTDLTTKVVIPGAKQQQISATARVPAVSVVSAGADHAVVLLFVNQTVTIGAGTPSETASSVRATLDKIDGKWLIAKFDPI